MAVPGPKPGNRWPVAASTPPEFQISNITLMATTGPIQATSNWAVCWRKGLLPKRWPVFRSCIMSAHSAMATDTVAPISTAVTSSSRGNTSSRNTTASRAIPLIGVQSVMPVACDTMIPANHSHTVPTRATTSARQAGMLEEK